MLNWVDLPGLPEKIHAAGHWVRHHTSGAGLSEWLCSDEPAVQAIVDGHTTAETAAFVCAQIDAHAKAEFDRHTAKFSPGEMAGWPVMREEALAYQADSMAAVPNMAAEAAARGCSVSTIASRVLANVAALQALRTAIMGTAGRHKDAVRALATREQVAAYNWQEGWPP